MNCPTDPTHGRTYDVGEGRWFCPHADHDKGGRSRCLFDEWEVMEGHVRNPLRGSFAKRGKKR